MNETVCPNGSALLFQVSGAAFLVSLAATWVVLRLATRLRLFDWPNSRSSHRVPTPTLGGFGIIAGTWSGFALIWSQEPFQASLGSPLWALAGGTAILSISVFDDTGRPLRVWEKLLLQLAAAGLAAALGVRFAGVTLPWMGSIPLESPWNWVVSILWIVGFINIFNFMDGIDGITVTQTLSAGLWLAAALFAVNSPLWLAPVVVAAAAIGFGVFNLPPARIFMGDVGSMFLGFVLAVVAIAGEASGLPLWLFAVIFGYYLFDTGYTLTRRMTRGENVFRAHRSHLYQLLVDRGWGQGRVDVAVLAANLLLGAGVYAALLGWRMEGAAAIAAAATMLVAAAVWLDRGRRVRSE